MKVYRILFFLKELQQLSISHTYTHTINKKTQPQQTLDREKQIKILKKKKKTGTISELKDE